MVERCRIRVEGPLAPYSAGFWAGLLSEGYTRLSAEKQMCLMAHLSRWLEGDACEASELTGQLAEEFLQARRAEGYATYLIGVRTLRSCPAQPVSGGMALAIRLTPNTRNRTDMTALLWTVSHALRLSSAAWARSPPTR